ncbi:MAG: ABC transporter permease [Patescibacteria group bacterium]|nr:ABC transporter permease [Patescibacteria group bacterium]
MTTIYIMWLRQVKRYLRSKSRIIGSLGQPILYLFALGYGLGQVFARAGQGNYIEFLAPGIIGMSVLFTSMFNGVEMIWDRQFGFLKETLVAPVSRFNIMLGRVLGGATVATLQGLIVFVLSFAAGFRLQMHNPVLYFFLAIVFMFLIALLFTALGTAIASMLTDFQGFQLIMSFVIMPTYFLSGAIFPLVGLPKLMSFITRIDPLTYGVDGLRGALTASNHFALSLDFSILVILSLIILSAGSYLFSKIQI